MGSRRILSETVGALLAFLLMIFVISLVITPPIRADSSLRFLCSFVSII